MFINVHHQKIKTPSPKQKKQHCNINDTTPSHHPLIIKTSQHHHHTSRRLHRTCPRRHQHITERPPKHHQKTNKTTPKQPRDITKKNRDRDMTETSQRHHQNNTETSPRQDRDKTKKGPRHNRDMTETSPRQDRDITETRKHHRSTYGPQLHWFAQRCTIYKFKLEFEILLKNPVKMFISVHHQKIKTQSPKQKKQHCNINDKTPSHHPLIIINITAPSPHITETSPKHARDVANDQRITERSPKHHPKTNKTTPKQQLDITKKRQRQDRDTTERRPRHD